MINNHDDWENRPRKYGLTAQDRQAFVDRHFEVMEQRQAEADLAFLQALKLGEAFKRLRGE